MFVLLFSASAFAADPAQVKGTVAGAHPFGVLTVALPNPAAGEPPLLRDFLINAQVEILLDGKAAKIQDLGRGIYVTITTSPDDAPPQKVEAFTRIADGTTQEMKGAVETIKSESIEILLDNRDRHVASVKITGETEIKVDGRRATAGDVKRRMYAVVAYVNDTAKGIDARTWINDDKPHNIVGTLKSFGDGKVVVHYGPAPPRQEGFDVVLPVSSSLKILRGADGTNESALIVGAAVKATYQNGVVEAINLVTR